MEGNSFGRRFCQPGGARLSAAHLGRLLRPAQQPQRRLHVDQRPHLLLQRLQVLALHQLQGRNHFQKQTNKRRKHSISFAKRFRPTRATRRSCPKVSPACRRTWTRRSCGRATARSTSSRCVRVVELVEQTRKKTETKRRLGSQGSKYWRFDPTQKPPVKSTYPKDVSNWEGLPNGLDGALAYTNGYSYFFKDGSYWRFNDRSFKVGVSATNHERCRR